MDNFREWLSDNLRYILLILGIAVVLIGLFFGIRAISQAYAGKNSNSEMASDSVIEASSVISSKEETSEESESSSVQTEEVFIANSNKDVTELMNSYYTALQNKDAASIKALVDTMTEQQSMDITSADTTTYSDIDVYTKNGMKDGEYIAYTTYTSKTDSQLTEMPGIGTNYIVTAADGSLKIQYSDYSDELKTFIEEAAKDEEVAALNASVETSLAEAQEKESSAQAEAEEASASAQAEAEAQAQAEAEVSNAAQAEVSQAAESSAESSAETTVDPERVETPAYTIGTCNIRSGPGYEYGVIFEDMPAGSQITVIGDTASGWRHIRYGNIEGYCGGRFVAYN